MLYWWMKQTSAQQRGIGWFLLLMPVWEGGTGCLLEVPCMDKSMDRRSVKWAFAQSFYWGKFVGRFTWSFEVQGRLLGSYSQSRELHGHSLYDTNLNNKSSMRCAGSEPPFKLLKYVFCSVLQSFVLNDPTDGHTSSKSSGRIDFDFRAGIFFLIFNLHLFWLSSIFWLSYTFLDQEISAAPHYRPPRSFL